MLWHDDYDSDYDYDYDDVKKQCIIGLNWNRKLD